MYLFSATATPKDQSGDQPFIVYIRFADLFGAEHLAKLYLMQAGYRNVRIEKRKQLDEHHLVESGMVAQDAAIKDAFQHGFHLQQFESH